MATYLNEFLFGFYPYLCIVVYFLGSWARFDRSQYTWRAQSSQLLRQSQLRWGSNLFHIGILLLFFGHFFGLLTPPEVYTALGLTVRAKQLLAIVAGGIFAIICFIGMTLLIHRRLFDPRIRLTSKKTDIFILLFIYVQLIIGMAGIPYSLADLSGGHMLVMAEWARSILTFQAGAAHLLEDVPWIYKIHILFGMTLFLLTPFTRLVHIFSAPIWYLGRPGYQIVRRNRNLGRGAV
jgi:nitrate reductase gamma subunit